MTKEEAKPADYIRPFNINGLRGRIMYLPAPKGKKREIMYVQGHHSSLERNFGVAKLLNRYGAVTVPDLPGFGGMDSFYKIGEKPTLDNLADYLAAVIKLRYRGRKITLSGLSLGFMIITRMLQKYPKLNKQVDLLVDFAGVSDKTDFNYQPRTYWTFRILTRFFSFWFPSAILKYVFLNGPLIKLGYAVFEPIFVKDKSSKIRSQPEDVRKQLIDFEVYLWKCNDIRTYMYVAHKMLTLTLNNQPIENKVYYIAVEGDRYFNEISVEQHLRQVFTEVVMVKSKVPSHAPSIIASENDALPFLPQQIRRLLNQTT